MKFCSACGSPQDRYLSIATAAKTFDLSEDAVRGMVKRREITFYKMNKRVRLKYADIEEMLVHHPANLPATEEPVEYEAVEYEEYDWRR